jgi:hypothetical protein
LREEAVCLLFSSPKIFQFKLYVVLTSTLFRAVTAYGGLHLKLDVTEQFLPVGFSDNNARVSYLHHIYVSSSPCPS